MATVELEKIVEIVKSVIELVVVVDVVLEVGIVIKSSKGSNSSNSIWNRNGVVLVQSSEQPDALWQHSQMIFVRVQLLQRTSRRSSSVEIVVAEGVVVVVSVEVGIVVVVVDVVEAEIVVVVVVEVRD